MRTSAISFGNRPQFPANHEEMQKKAYAQIMKHYQETGKYVPAKIDYYEGKDPVITYFEEVSKTNILQKFKNILKRIFKK